jgi:hypothetical protein
MPRAANRAFTASAKVGPSSSRAFRYVVLAAAEKVVSGA